MPAVCSKVENGLNSHLFIERQMVTMHVSTLISVSCREKSPGAYHLVPETHTHTWEQLNNCIVVANCTEVVWEIRGGSLCIWTKFRKSKARLHFLLSHTKNQKEQDSLCGNSLVFVLKIFSGVPARPSLAGTKQ